MKYTYLLLTMFFIVGCQPKELPTIISITDSGAIVKFSHQTTRSEMTTASNELKSKYNVDVDYKGSTYFEDGKLRVLNVAVRLADGSGGKTKADLAKLQYAYYGFAIEANGDQVKMKSIGNIAQ